MLCVNHSPPMLSPHTPLVVGTVKYAVVDVLNMDMS